MSAANSVSFNIGDLVQRAWRILMDNAVVLIVGFLVIAVIEVAMSLVLRRFAGLGTLVVSGPFILGYYGAALKASRRESVPFGQIFAGFQRFVPALLANLVISSFTLIGTVLGFVSTALSMLCIIPGIFLALIYCTTYFYMHDQNMDFWPALESSRLRVMGNLGQWIVLFLVLVALNIGGAIPCGLGLFLTMPLSAVILALAYEQTRA